MQPRERNVPKMLWLAFFDESNRDRINGLESVAIRDQLHDLIDRFKRVLAVDYDVVIAFGKIDNNELSVRVGRQKNIAARLRPYFDTYSPINFRTIRPMDGAGNYIGSTHSRILGQCSAVRDLTARQRLEAPDKRNRDKKAS